MNEAAADDFTPISGAMRVRTKRAVTRGRGVGPREAAVWLTAAAAIALFVTGGGVRGRMTAWDYGYALGRMVGLVAAVLILTQVMLIARTPWVERALGHDR